ncbi:MAG: PhoH family protein [Gammaproteobacteria bacterium]|nr:PhoH family protein [Gammaproteobacteria bacterium]MCP4089163.1 PhoH family protein [Gammaproteobacteria bacterium]MCP4276813.1 PhoH family protein [Gammaproteobacteria bacterium]MCP4830656.1 PhoH family protein [Gammaproteobacteria bacterium]MCP4928465.1 PhoH family protein [Gammaproteobacteria bacterium]
MNAAIETREFLLEPANNNVLANLCGQFDEHLRQIEQRLGVHISNRGNHFRVVGPRHASAMGEQVIQELYVLATKETLNLQRVHICLQETVMNNKASDKGDGKSDQNSRVRLSSESLSGVDAQVISTRRVRIQPRGSNQKNYVANLRSKDLCFGIGPAGTGKTYLAVASAVESLDQEHVRRIVLVRPAVEAGERLGFLPGDMSQKVDPYLRPMYDALYEMLGSDQVARLIEKNIIEIAPLAFMRGRSLNECFIILDEAQNTTAEQMKMFLTRMGFGSRAVVTGDITQIDLPNHQASGLKHIADVLTDVEGVSFDYFSSRDVVRHPLVQKIVEAYEDHEYRTGPE